MEIWQIVGLGLIVAIIGTVLKEVRRNEIAIQMVILAGTIIFVLVLDKIKLSSIYCRGLQNKRISVLIICLLS